MVWYPINTQAKSEFAFRFFFILYHYVPAFFVDIFLKIKGSTMRLIPVYSKIYAQMNLIAYFSNRSWEFEAKNKHEIYQKMSEKDHLDFPCQPNDQELIDMYPKAIAGIVKYFFLETDEDMIKARKKYNNFKILHYCFLAVLYSTTIYLCYRTFGEYCLRMLLICMKH